MNYQREIDIKDFLKRLCSIWKIFICGILIGVLIFSILGYIKSRKNVEESTILDKQNGNEISSMNIQEKLDEYSKNMSETQVENAQYAVEQYDFYKNAYITQKNYLENSYKMNLDANDICEGTIIYYIDNYYNVSYPNVLSYNPIKDLASGIVENAIGLMEWDQKHFERDLFFYKIDNASLIITIYAKDEEQFINIKQRWDNAIAQSIETEKEIFGDFRVVTLSESCEQRAEPLLSDEQVLQQQKLSTLRTSMKSILNSLDEKELGYVNIWSKKDSIPNETQNEELNVDSVQSVNFLNVKYIILGIFMGIFCVAVFYFIFYSFQNTVNTKREMEKVIGQKCDHVIVEGNKKFWMDYKLLDKLGKNNDGIIMDDYLKILSTQLSNTLNNIEKNVKICLISSSTDVELNQIKNKIKEYLEKDNFNIILMDSVMNNSDSIKALMQDKKVIVLEKTDLCNRNKLIWQSEFLSKYQVDILQGIFIDY